MYNAHTVNLSGTTCTIYPEPQVAQHPDTMSSPVYCARATSSMPAIPPQQIALILLWLGLIFNGREEGASSEAESAVLF